MHVPLLPSVNNFDAYVTGDVTIDPNAAIAPGAIIQADPNSRITIAAGVCIGMGTILHAHQGNLEVESGAILGAGVLVIGKGKIGRNACIGAATTIWNYSVEPGQLVPAGSLLGETGRPAIAPDAPEVTKEEVPVVEAPAELNGKSQNVAEPEKTPPTPQPAATEEAPPAETPPEPPPALSVNVYGQANLNRLLLTLFPHKAANQPPESEENK